MKTENHWMIRLFILLFSISVSVAIVPCGVVNIYGALESLIYDSLNISKLENSTLKQDVRKVTIKENKGMSAEGLGKIYVLAVMYVVFANTDSFTEEIDRRIPFRNHILHNGIIMYSDEEIETVYELLLELILQIYSMIK